MWNYKVTVILLDLPSDFTYPRVGRRIDFRLNWKMYINITEFSHRHHSTSQSHNFLIRDLSFSFHNLYLVTGNLEKENATNIYTKQRALRSIWPSLRERVRILYLNWNEVKRSDTKDSLWACSLLLILHQIISDYS